MSGKLAGTLPSNVQTDDTDIDLTLRPSALSSCDIEIMNTVANIIQAVR